MAAKKTSGASVSRQSLLALFSNFLVRPNVDEITNRVGEPPPIFSNNEIQTLLNTSRNGRGLSNNLKGHVKQTSDSVSTAIRETESYTAMLPEAAKAEAIFTTSILAPTDLNGTELMVSLTNSNLPEEVNKKISAAVHTVINDRLHIITKLKPWIGSALYHTGATPVLLVPRSIPRYLSDLSAEVNKTATDGSAQTGGTAKVEPGLEALVGLTPEELSKTMDITPECLKTDGSKNVGLNIGLESFDATLDHLEGIVTDDLDRTKVGAAMHSSMGKLIDILRGHVDISLDVSKIQASTESAKNFANKKTKNNVKYSYILRVGQDKMLNFDIDGDATFSPKEHDEPVLMRLPTSCVVPIIVPGSPETRLGYYVAVDSSGNPIDCQSETPLTENVAQRTDILGALKAEGVKSFDDMSKSKRSEIANDMFEVLINSTLDSALNNISDKSRTITKNKRLATAIFSKALKQQKISLIFVPSEYMAYYAFDYREDGTGKSLIEDASTLIALRTSCIVAKVATIMTNAIDDHKIEYSLGDGALDATNVEQINEMLVRMYVDKYMYKPSHDTTDIMRNLWKKSVSVVPKNFNNLKDFNITKEVTQRSIGQIDDTLEDMLTRFITMLLRVPAGAIDDVHERDFSRSVATTNLLFANDIRTAQMITTRESDIIIKAYVRHSYSLRTQISKILDEASENIKLGEEVSKEDLLEYCIACITTSLPKPNVSPDQARLSEIVQHCRTIEEIVDLMWNEELIASDDPKLKQTLLSFKALLKHDKIKELLGKSGDSTLSTLPDIDFGDSDMSRVLHQTMLNYSTMIERMISAAKAEDNKVNDSNSGGGGRFY